MLSFQLLHLKITTILVITSKNYFGYIIPNLSLFGYYKIYSLFIISNSTSIPTATSDTIAVRPQVLKAKQRFQKYSPF